LFHVNWRTEQFQQNSRISYFMKICSQVSYVLMDRLILIDVSHCCKSAQKVISNLPVLKTTTHLKIGVDPTSDTLCISNIPRVMDNVQHNICIVNHPSSSWILLGSLRPLNPKMVLVSAFVILVVLNIWKVEMICIATYLSELFQAGDKTLCFEKHKLRHFVEKLKWHKLPCNYQIRADLIQAED
jgi:hypothetical protein